MALLRLPPAWPSEGGASPGLVPRGGQPRPSVHQHHGLWSDLHPHGVWGSLQGCWGEKCVSVAPVSLSCKVSTEQPYSFREIILGVSISMWIGKICIYECVSCHIMIFNRPYHINIHTAIYKIYNSQCYFYWFIDLFYWFIDLILNIKIEVNQNKLFKTIYYLKVNSCGYIKINVPPTFQVHLFWWKHHGQHYKLVLYIVTVNIHKITTMTVCFRNWILL